MTEQLKSEKLVPVLLIIVVVMAFMMGTMWNKLQTLSNGGVGTATTGLQGNNVPQAPAPTVLTEDQIEKIANDGNPPTLGKSNAPVTIVEFSDLQCPFCKQFADATFGQIKSEYVDSGKVRIVYRHYPLRAIHPDAANAGMAAECANEQGKFWEFHDEVYKNQTALSLDSLKKYATNIGLNKSRFDSCLDSQKYKATIEEDESLGNSVGVSGTPAFFINGKLISGAMPFDSFKTEIEAALK